MPRILADLPDDDIDWLDRQAATQGCSRAALLRDAVRALRAGVEHTGIESYFGLWRDREDLADAVDWQQRERAGATREWDADLDDVKAQFPELFEEGGESAP